MRLFNNEGLGKLYSQPVSRVPVVTESGTVVQADAAADETQETKGDKSLPDPTSAARVLAALLAGAAVVGAFILDKLDLAHQSFDPAKIPAANFALFAGFYVAALLIERAGEIVAPIMPPWAAPIYAPPPPGQAGHGPALDADARAAHVKADRAMVMLGINFLAGVALAAALGLYFMTAIGMQVSRPVDIVLTALVIAGGTKKLHDFMTLVQNKNNPTTGVGAT